MLILWFLIIPVALVYIIIIGRFFAGWEKLQAPPPGTHAPGTFVSVIIPVRNEERNLQNLLDGFLLQDYPADLMEAIIVDDHSTDGTAAIADDNCAKNKNLKLIKLTSNDCGKKKAISEGVNLAKGNLIVTTDADCRMGSGWLTAMVACYETCQPKMIAGPVVMEREQNFWQKLQSLEFMSLVGTGAGAMAVNHAIMCNGANLAFEKDAYLDYRKKTEKYVSGDDQFLLFHLKKKDRNSILFLKSEQAVVYTRPQETLQGFASQRLRWTSKSRAYRDADVIVTAFVVFITNLLLLTLLAGSFFKLKILAAFLLLFAVKSTVDFIFLDAVTAFFKKRELVRYLIPAQFVYFFYIVLAGILGNMLTFDWKGRNYKSGKTDGQSAT